MWLKKLPHSTVLYNGMEFFSLQTESVEGVIFLGSIRYESLKKVYDSRVSTLTGYSVGMFSLNAFIFLPGYSVLLLLHGVHILINEKILNIKIEFHQEKFVLCPLISPLFQSLRTITKLGPRVIIRSMTTTGDIMATITKKVPSKSPLNFLSNQKRLKVGVVFVMEVVEVVLFLGVIPVLLIEFWKLYMLEVKIKFR